MKFYEVQPALEAGNQIHRKTFYKTCYLILENEKLTRKSTEGECYTCLYTLNNEDLLADDWEIDIPSRVLEYDHIPYIKCPRCGKRVITSFHPKLCKCSFCGQETNVIKGRLYITVPFVVHCRGISVIGGSEHETLIEIRCDDE